MYKDFGQITNRMHPPRRHTYRTPPSALPWLYLPWVVIGGLIGLGLLLNLLGA